MQQHPLPPNLLPVLPQYSDPLPSNKVGRKTKLRAPKISVLLTCDVVGCGYSTLVKKYYNQHVTRVHNRLVGHRLQNGVAGLPCVEAGCTKSFACRVTLRTHELKEHKIDNRPLLKCDVSDCPYVSRRSMSIFQHHAIKHNIGKGVSFKKCDVEGCDYQNRSATNLIIHKAIIHNIDCEKLPPCLRCDKTGCNFFAASSVTIKNHRESVHGDVIPTKKCDFPGCQYTAKHSDDIKMHKAYRHDIDIIWRHCPEADCEYKGKSIRDISTHLLKKHKKHRGKVAKDTAAERKEDRKDVNATL